MKNKDYNIPFQNRKKGQSTEELASQLAQKANQTDLTVKADRTYVDSEIAKKASGAPKGVYATLTALQTALPTGSTDNQLVTADGKWYYWNGSAWTAGAVYQATGIANDSVTKDMMQVKFNGFNVQFAQDTMILENKTTTPRADQAILNVPAHTGIADIFVKFTLPSTIASTSAFLYLNGSFSYPIGIGSVSGTTCNVYYHSAGVTTDSLPYSSTYYVRFYNDGTNTTVKVYSATGTLLGTYSIAETLNITSIQFRSATVISMYDVVMFNGILSDDLMSEYFFGTTRPLFVDSFINNGKTFGLKPLAKNTYLQSGQSVEDRLTFLKPKLEGKKSVHFGDSITGNYEAPVDYPSYIANLTGLQVNNVGIGSTRMAYSGGSYSYDGCSMVKFADAIVSGDWTTVDSVTLIDVATRNKNRLKSIDFNTVDYITLFFGTNDYTGTKKLDNDVDKMDISSYGGAARYVLDKLLMAFPHLKILLIAPMYRDRLSVQGDGQNSDITTQGGFYLSQYADKLVQIGKEFHVPVLNLMDTSGVNKYTASTLFEDGLHPNQELRQVLGSKIASALLTQW